MDEEAYAIIEPGISNPIIFNQDICTGCNRCMEVCQVDLFIPNQKKGKPPNVIYPGECWYCGCCVAECPNPGAIKLNPILMNLVHWKPRTTF
ncbi:MAG: ferredoxin family protein [Candidatus Thorarchaeota archaeon]